METEKTPLLKIFPDFSGLTEVNCSEQKNFLKPLVPLKHGTFFIATFMKKLRPVVAVKDEFACQIKSKVIAVFGFFGLSRF